jgi:hypothetical protein
MARTKVTFETVRELAMALPGVEETTAWRSPAFKVKKRMFAVQPVHKSAEPESVCIIVDFMERDLLLSAEPEVFYVKPHYQNYPCVLVRLSKIKKTALKELLRDGYDFVQRKKHR